MKKIFRKIHLWLSIPLGLMISVVCLSGAALVFETEITELCHPARFYVSETSSAPLPVGELLAAVRGNLPDSVSITGINISSDPSRAYRVNLSKPRRSSIYIDQYTGEIKERNQRGQFFTFMFRMHRWLLDSVKPEDGISVGKLAVGIATLFLVFILLSGIIIWIPRTRKALANRLKINGNKGTHRFWYDLHVSGGIYIAVILLALALTGLTWSFPWYRTMFYAAFGVEVSQPQRSGTQKNSSFQSGFIHWQQVYEQLRRQNPDYKQITIAGGNAAVAFGHRGNRQASDRYTFNPQNGEITGISLYKDQDKSAKIRGWIYSVHVGDWGGMFTRILTFLAALLGGTLPLTGYYLWIRKMIRKR